MIIKIIDILLGLPKSIIVNFKLLPFKQAIRLPILVSHKTKLFSLFGHMQINYPLRMGLFTIGLNGAGTLLHKPSVLEINGLIVCNGRVNFGGGCQICCSKAGIIELGDNTTFSGGCHIIARKKVRFGNDCTISWNTLIMDTDSHKIYKDGICINSDKDIFIGNHVWVGANCTVLKGSNIPNGCIVSADSLIIGKAQEENSIISGNPIKVIKSDISWQL